MYIQHIPIIKLVISTLNVRKIITSETDETTIKDLSDDILKNGLINPITVRKMDGSDVYEILAGQRRFMAIKLLGYEHIMCNIITATDQKAEEISLVENLQRSQLTTTDKVLYYSKLYKCYDNDIDKLSTVVHISKMTLKKYIKISQLSDDILQLLDAKDSYRITLEVAVELTKIKSGINTLEIINTIQQLNNIKRIKAIKEYVGQNYETPIDEIVFKLTTTFEVTKPITNVPFVIDEETNEHIIIPQHLWKYIIEYVKTQ